MKKNVFRKSLVIGIIILFVGASVIPSISGNLLKNTIAQDKDINEEDININNNNLNGEVYDWPMFHHDLNHTGYTDGKGSITGPYKNWSKPYSNWVESSPALGNLDEDDYLEVVYGCMDHKVYAYDGETGLKEWEFKTDGDVFSSPAISDGKVYIGSYDFNVYCIDGDGGTEIWSYPTEDRVMSSPAVTDGRVYIGSSDGYMYCLDANTGDFIWRFKTGGEVQSSPALGDIDNDGIIEVVFGSNDKNVYALDAVGNGDGTTNLIWNYSTDGEVQSSPALGDIDNDGIIEVVFGSYDNYVYALNSTGKEKWRFKTYDVVFSSPALGDIDNDGIIEVVFGSGHNSNNDKRVYAIDGETGEKEWNFEADKNVKSSPALGDIDNDGIIEVVVGSFDKNLYVLNSTGKEKWHFEADGWVDTSPALGDIDNDGLLEIVFGSGWVEITEHLGNVYVLDEDTEDPVCRITRPKKGWLYINDDPIGYNGLTTIIFIPPHDEFTVEVEVTDNSGVPDGIERLDFYCDEKFLGSVGEDAWDDHDEVYRFTWQKVPPRPFGCRLSVEVYDKSGNMGKCRVGVNPRSKSLVQNEFPILTELLKNHPQMFPFLRLLLQRFGLQ